MPTSTATPSILPVENVGRAKKRLRKPMQQPGQIHIKEWAQELCISFPENAVHLADTYNKHYFYIHTYSILMFTNRGKIFKMDDYLCLSINPGTLYMI